MVRGKEKASTTNLRKDPAWKYSTQVDIGGGSDKTYVYLKCNFCEKVVKGGVTRMKEHLSCSHKNVAPCSKVPEAVRTEMTTFMRKASMSKELAQRQFNDRVDAGSHSRSGPSGKDSSSFPQVGTHTQLSSRGARGPIDAFMTGHRDEVEEVPPRMSQTAREARRRACFDIGRFFFENAISFNVANSPSFINMIRSIGDYGRGLKPPSMYDLRTWVLKEEMSNTEKNIEEIKRTWCQTGVTIMSDGWSDMKSRSLINILVNNPYGTVFLRSVDASSEIKNADYLFGLLDGVIDEIGEDIVVQVVTDNASAYKAAGQKLMAKRPHMYWTPCAAHCIDLMLERLGSLPQHRNALIKAKKISKFIYNHSWVLALMRKFSKRELLRPAATRFATSYLTL